MNEIELLKKLLKKQIQKNQLLSLVGQGGFEFTTTWLPYTSGKVGNYYVQSIDITADGYAYRSAIDDMVDLIIADIGEDNFDVISGGESRDWDFSNPIAVALGKPHTKLYKNGKIIGAKVEGKRVLHVADLNNEGSSPRDAWVPMIKKAGGTITDILFYVDRMEDGVEEMKKLGLTSHCAIPLDNVAWRILLKAGKISKKEFESLQARWTDKEAWAHNALMTHPEKLAEMIKFGIPEVVAKGQKILDVGYPEIKDQLLKLIND